MKFFRVWAVARKEFIQIWRDPRSLGMAIVIPMLLLILFGYALTLDVDNVPLAVWDQDNSPASRDLISRFAGSRYFNIRVFVGDYHGLERAIDTGNVLGALVVPVGFAGTLIPGRVSPVQLIIDGSDANTATLAMAYARMVALGYSNDVVLRATRRTALIPLRIPIEIRPRVWFNSDMESRNFIIPGLIAVIMMVIAALMTSLTVAREWERGTMEQLISTPIRATELIAGKLLPYFFIGMTDVLLAVLMGEYLFAIPLRGSVALLFMMSVVFLACALSLGLMISIVTRSQLLASQLAMVATFVPSFLLSGFMFAIDNMPQAIQVITYAIPARYFVAIMKGIYLKGIGLEILFYQAVFLALLGALILLVAHAKFKKKVAL